MKLMRLIVFSVFMCLAAWPIASFAQSCSVNAPLDFGTVDPMSGQPVQAQGTVTVNCTGMSAQPYVRVCLNIGSPSGHYMIGPGGAKLQFELYQDATRTTIWGSYWGSEPAMPVDVAVSGGAGSAQKSFYGTVFAGQSGSPAGSYTANISDSVLVATYYTSSVAACTNSGHFSQVYTVTSKATINTNCMVSAANIEFGQVGVLKSAVTSTGVITTTCTQGTAYTLSLSAGTGSGATFASRKLMRSGGGGTLDYGLYRDSGRTQVWGDGTGGSTTVTGTGSGSAQTATVYAALPAQASASPGAYSDTITLTVTF